MAAEAAGPGWKDRAYRAAWVVGAALYVSCFLMGLLYTLINKKRLPAYDLSALSQAAEHLRRGDVPRAAREYRMVIRIDRASYDTPRQLMELLQGAGDSSGQIDLALAQRDRFPRMAAAHRNLGWAYLSNKRYDEARASFQDALALDPADIDAHRGIAEAWLDQDRYPQAIAGFGEVLRRRPDDAGAHNSLAITLVLAGRRAEALAHFEEAVRLDPQFARNLERARAGAGPPRP